MSDLYAANTPSRFWRFDPVLGSDAWEAAIQEALSIWPEIADVYAKGGWDNLTEHILGESRYGANHWQLGRGMRIYYDVFRPILPRQIRPILHWLVRFKKMNGFALDWPIEDHYVRFLYAIKKAAQMRHPEISAAPFWPSGARFAIVLTHDVETAAGQTRVRELADIEEEFGFRSSCNFVPEGYRVDQSLLAELRERGFEIGVHGLKHDGKLFVSRKKFEERVILINRYIKDWGAVGFRAPSTHRNPEWMQALNIEYDSSFFDTDPFEPIPGGTMSIWPFFCGKFVELPYTLPQDFKLYEMYGRGAVDIWIRKVNFIAKWGGMALVNVHPDYTCVKDNLKIYKRFLMAMKEKEDYWHALPREAARWWRHRAKE
jgi:hypothetical protein